MLKTKNSFCVFRHSCIKETNLILMLSPLIKSIYKLSSTMSTTTLNTNQPKKSLKYKKKYTFKQQLITVHLADL